MKGVFIMYGYMYPVYGYPIYGNSGGNNDSYGGSWIWGIIIVLFIIFFLFWGNNNNNGCYQNR